MWHNFGTGFISTEYNETNEQKYTFNDLQHKNTTKPEKNHILKLLFTALQVHGTRP